jgi:hypothetical protein
MKTYFAGNNASDTDLRFVKTKTLMKAAGSGFRGRGASWRTVGSLGRLMDIQDEEKEIHPTAV